MFPCMRVSLSLIGFTLWYLKSLYLSNMQNTIVKFNNIIRYVRNCFANYSSSHVLSDENKIAKMLIHYLTGLLQNEK